MGHIIGYPSSRVIAAGAGGCSLLAGAPTTNLQFDHVGECLVGADGSVISAWADAAPAANDLGTFGGSPSAIKKTNILNGLSVARMDGDDNAVFSSPIAVTSAFTYICVVKFATLAGQETLICGPTGSLQVRTNGSKFNILKCATADIASGNTTLSTGVWYTLGVSYDGSTAKFYLNGSADGSVSASQSFSANVTKVWVNVANSGEVMVGDLAEHLLWTAVITEATHMLNGGGGVTDALRTKYAHY